MSKVIRIYTHGGTEVLKLEDVPMPEPGPGEVLIRHKAVGLNYADVYFRVGSYEAPLPTSLGVEGAGEVLAVGAGVTEFQPGERVAYAGGPLGAYSTERVISADRLVKLPDTIDDTTAAAMLLQGFTAHYLLRRTRRVQAGDTILVHAAAGGVGLILCQWAKHIGATVIGVVSTPEKAAVVKEYGADHAIVGSTDLAGEVKRITGGKMVQVVYDSVGKHTFMASLDCLAPFGLMVSYGIASGPVPPVDLGLLAAKSLFLTRPSLATYTATREDRLEAAAELFDVVQKGGVKIRVSQTFPLASAAEAHALLESRQTMGSIVLIP